VSASLRTRRSAPRALADARAGFSLAELAVVVMIVGILAGVAIPNLVSARYRAEAAHIVSDVHTIQLAAYGYLGDNGKFPPSAGYGSVPPQLAPYLPDGYEFSYHNVQYAWWSFNFSSPSNWWGTRNLGIVIVYYPTRGDLADALKSQMGPDIYWNPVMMYFIYRG